MQLAKTLKWLWAVCLAMLFTACYYPRQDYADEWDMTEGKRDSLDFASRHHYNENFNFLVVADTLYLREQRPWHNENKAGKKNDSLQVTAGDRLVVADILIIPEDSVDSVWVKVARDQVTMGWVHEQYLLKNVIPDDSISQFIHFFSNKHLIYFISFMGLMLVVYIIRRQHQERFRMVHFDDIESLYPTMLCIVLSGSATLYASIQNFIPDTWVEFYFHPTLNPFGLPFIIGFFIASVWLVIILAIASVDDVCKQLPVHEAILYLIALLGMCAGCYLFFSLTTLYYIGYPCYIFYVYWSLSRYFRIIRNVCLCGHCGRRIRSKGYCPYCGAWNE